MAAQALQAKTIYKITLRYRDDLVSSWRIRQGVKLYEITAVLPDSCRRRIELRCKTGEAIRATFSSLTKRGARFNSVRLGQNQKRPRLVNKCGAFLYAGAGKRCWYGNPDLVGKSGETL